MANPNESEMLTEEAKVGLEKLDDDVLADIVNNELAEGSGEPLDKWKGSAANIAFHELAKRSGWNIQ